MATFHELSSKQLRKAIKLSERMEALQQKLSALRDVKQKVTGKRTISAAGRAAIAAAQKARWAKLKGKASPKTATPVKTAPKKKVMSPEAKAKIAAAMKARWAAKRKDNVVE